MEWYDPIVAIATLGSVIVTAIIASLLYKQSNEMKIQTQNLEGQTNEMKKEISGRMRPWLNILNIKRTHVLTERGDRLTTSEYLEHPETYGKIKEHRYSFFVENIGSMPTEKYVVKFLSGIKHITKEMMWEKGKGYHGPQPLMPKEKATFRYSISEEDHANNVAHYYGIHIGYFLNDKVSTTIGKIWKIDLDTIMIEDSWIDQPE